MSTQLGDCFEASANALLPRLSRAHTAMHDYTDVQLVHGIVTGQGPMANQRFTHGWLEGTDAQGLRMAIDASNGKHIVLPAALYYAIGQIDEAECVHYTAEEARERMLAVGTYGPWDGAPASHQDPLPVAHSPARGH